MSVVNSQAQGRAVEVALARWTDEIIGRIADWWNYRRTVRALSALTDRELDDIGVSRSEIRRAACYGR